MYPHLVGPGQPAARTVNQEAEALLLFRRHLVDGISAARPKVGVSLVLVFPSLRTRVRSDQEGTSRLKPSANDMPNVAPARDAKPSRKASTSTWRATWLACARTARSFWWKVASISIA
jgi:hypothetical protein